MSFHIWHATRDRSAWLDTYNRWARREVFAHPDYLRLFAREQDEAYAAVSESAAGLLIYPFILRPIDAGHLASVAPNATDLTSPYGYGGPYRDGTGTPEFWSQFEHWARTQNCVTEFVRCSLFADTRLDHPAERHERQLNVVCDLTDDEASIHASFDHKVRKNVAKAQRSGVTIEFDTDGRRLDAFLSIYLQTMVRRDARQSFHFQREFFESIIRELADQFVFVHALHEGRVISTELALVSVDNVYSFLGGTDSAMFELRPNDLLKYELINWAKRHGHRRFVLGGGYSREDGIFKYKRAFAPHGTVPYFIGTRVFDHEVNAALCEAHRAACRAIDPDWHPDPDFFPTYRSPLPASPVERGTEHS